MSRGRKPDNGERALTNAERQARYRLRRQAEQAPPPLVRPRRAPVRRLRMQRWNDAVADLLALQAEYAGWLDALPESLQESAMADALRAVADLNLDDLAAVVPPRGYGRD